LLLLVAGHETTANLVGNAVLALRSHPRALSRLRADPALMGPAVEELLRFDSPVQLVGRGARADAVLGPLTIEAGQQVLVCLGAANRDRAACDGYWSWIPDSIRARRTWSVAARPPSAGWLTSRCAPGDHRQAREPSVIERAGTFHAGGKARARTDPRHGRAAAGQSTHSPV
jgi:hypothetical protein